MGICVVYPFNLVPINVQHCNNKHPFDLVHYIIYTFGGNEMQICVVYLFHLVPINVHHCETGRPFNLVPNIIYTLGCSAMCVCVEHPFNLVPNIIYALGGNEMEKWFVPINHHCKLLRLNTHLI